MSPIDGLSSIATAQVGDLVGPSTGVLSTVTKVDPIKVNFSAAEQEYIDFVEQFFEDPSQSPIGKANAKSGLTELTLTLANGKVYPRTGKLTAVSSTVNVGTGSLSMQGIFPNPGNLLRPGQFGLVTAVTKVLPDGIAIPQRAIGDLQGISQVGIVGPGDKVTIKAVTVGPTIGSLQVIEEGLSAGDVIVVEGLQKIKDGAVVRTKPYQMDPEEADSISMAERGTVAGPELKAESSPTPDLDPPVAAGSSASPAPAVSATPAAPTTTPAPAN